MANRTHLLLALGAVLFGAVSVFAPARTADAAGPTIAVSPASASVLVGGDVTLDITVDAVGAPGVGGYLIVLTWDPAVLSLTSLSDSGWVTGGDIIVFCDSPTIDSAAGNAYLDCTPILAFGPGVTTESTQSLAQAVFHASAAGTTSIDLTDSNLLNPSKVVIAGTLANGTINVSAVPTATPAPATATVAATVAATGTAAASATVTAPGTATSTSAPGGAATSNVEANSTNAGGGTLSNVEAPQAGSGDGSEGPSRTAWWIAGIAAAAAVTAGGAAAYGWNRRRNRA